MRIAAVWPRPRKHRWTAGRLAPAQFPDASDALLYLEAEGFEVVIEDSFGIPLNPLVRVHEFYSGLDPARALRLAMRVRRYDAAVCVGDASAFVLMWLRERFGFRLPIVLVDPALSYEYPRRRRLQDYVLPRAQRVVVFGRTQMDYLAREYGPAVHATFLHHRADTEFYRPDFSRSDAPAPTPVSTRASTPVPTAARGARPAPAPTAAGGERPYVLSVGNDVSRDFDTLAKAAAICRASAGFDLRFVVQTTRSVDDPAAVLDLRRDTISYPDLRALYAGASLVVLPLFDKIHAGGINTLLEAMAMARPLVVSASRGMADYVKDGETAAVVGVGDAEAMAQAILALTRAPADAQRLGDNARRFLVEQCDNRVYAKAMAGILCDVVAAARR
ncbi:MAG: glycosyltransferase family 4 protein [Acidobacteriota bacterium]